MWSDIPPLACLQPSSLRCELTAVAPRPGRLGAATPPVVPTIVLALNVGMRLDGSLEMLLPPAPKTVDSCVHGTAEPSASAGSHVAMGSAADSPPELHMIDCGIAFDTALSRLTASPKSGPHTLLKGVNRSVIIGRALVLQ